MCVCKFVQTLLPKLSLEWNHTRNNTTPAEVTAILTKWFGGKMTSEAAGSNPSGSELGL